MNPATLALPLLLLNMHLHAQAQQRAEAGQAKQRECGISIVYQREFRASKYIVSLNASTSGKALIRAENGFIGRFTVPKERVIALVDAVVGDCKRLGILESDGPDAYSGPGPAMTVLSDRGRFWLDIASEALPKSVARIADVWAATLASGSKQIDAQHDPFRSGSDTPKVEPGLHISGGAGTERLMQALLKKHPMPKDGWQALHMVDDAARQLDFDADVNVTIREAAPRTTRQKAISWPTNEISLLEMLAFLSSYYRVELYFSNGAPSASLVGATGRAEEPVLKHSE